MAKNNNDPITLDLGMGLTQTYDREAETLVVRVDLMNPGRPTGPRKDKEGNALPPSGNRLVATTGGNQTVCDGLKLGINCYDEVKGREDIPADVFAAFDGREIVHGRGVIGVLDGTTLVLTIDAGGDLGPTKSGKSRTVATTGGNAALPGGLKIGVNCYDPIPAPRS
jgi:hypothetical protein